MPGAKPLLGIDLRVTSVKVVEIENNETPSLKNWGMTEVPYQLLDKHPQLEDAQADALFKLIQDHKILARDAIVVAAGSETLVRRYSLSALPRAEAAAAIKWKLLEELTYPIEEAIIDFYPLTGGALSGRVDYVAACINQKYFQRIQYLLNKIGLNLVGITVLPEALHELYKNEMAESNEKIVSAIYMGRHTTNISIYKSGEFEFNRELNIGGENITRAMAGTLVTPEKRIELSFEQAEKIKTESGISLNAENFPNIGDIPVSQLQAMVRPTLEKVQSEVARTFEYYKGQSGEGAVNKIILTGGSSLTPNFKEFLSAGLGIPVATPEPFPKLDARLTAAMGAALTGALRLNLLPDDVKFRWRNMVNRYLRPQIVLPAFGGLLFVIYLLFWSRGALLQRELDYLQKKIDEYKPQLVRLEAIERVSQAEEKMKVALQSFEQSRSRLPAVFEELSRLIPPSVTINGLTLSAAEIHLLGTSFRKGTSAETNLSSFILKLSASPVFKNVKLVQAEKNSDYLTEALNFEVIAKVRGK